MKIARLLAASIAIVLAMPTLTAAQDPGWPRQLKNSGGTLVYYQPQVDDWKDYTTITWRQAFQLTPAGGKQVVGAATIKGSTNVDPEKHMVVIHGMQVTNTYFPSADAATSAKMEQLLKSFLPPTVDIALERVVASLPKPQVAGAQVAGAAQLKNDPPAIFVSNSPAILLQIDGEPSLAPVPNTKLKFVVNTQWPVFLDTNKSKYYLLVGQRWFSGTDLRGPWSAVTALPKDMEKLPKDPQWAGLKAVIPPPAQASGPVPKIFFSTVPAEVILFNGQPVYGGIPNTQLMYATNTDSPIFLHKPTNNFYYLTAGRWFRSTQLTGKWTFASLDLPADFAKIPSSSPVGTIRASVPGTEEAKDAVLIAQIPTVMEIDPKTAAAQAKVTYSGDPNFAPIEGTSLSYATNTQDKVIKVGSSYYLCLQGVWFQAPNAQGPWTTATSIPKEIYAIPPSSPVYNVTYVTQTATPSGTVQSSYTSGYLGTFVVGMAMGAILANGTGYYYPPYMYYPPYGYPIYRPYPYPYGAYGGGYYNNYNGSYGRYVTAYGPYGSTTRTASYNPYTGTYKTGANVATPYGSRSVGQAYNPYTGTYAATRQGSNPSAQWGQSYVSNGYRSAYTQHYSTAQGTVGTIRGSQGGAAVGVSGNRGSGAIGRTSGGDLYAGHDGNVYRNTGSGWQKYDNGGWNSVNTPQPVQPAANKQSTTTTAPRSNAQPRPASTQQSIGAPRTATMSTATLNAEMQNRQRGSVQAQNWQRSAGVSRNSSGRGFSGGGGRRRR